MILPTRNSIRTFLFAVLTVVLGGASTQTIGDVVVLNSSKDNTLFESTTGALSNGAGQLTTVLGPVESCLGSQARVQFYPMRCILRDT